MQPLSRPNEMPAEYSDNMTTVWLATEGSTTLPTVDIDVIADDVCRVFSITRSQLLGATRKREIVMPRHIFIYVAYRLTGQSHESIAAFTGGRDHTGSVYSCKSVEGFLETKDDIFGWFWLVFKTQSKYYYPSFEKKILQKRVTYSALRNKAASPKRYTASLMSLQRDILGSLNVDKMEFVYRVTHKGVYSRWIFVHMASCMDYRASEIDLFLGRPDGQFTSDVRHRMLKGLPPAFHEYWIKYQRNSVYYKEKYNL